MCGLRCGYHLRASPSADTIMRELVDQALASTWAIEVFVIVTVTLVVRMGLRYLMRHLKRLATRSKNVWDDALVEAARLPLGWTILGVGMLFALDVGLATTDSGFADYVGPVRQLWIVVMLGWFVIRLIGRMEAHYIDRIKQKADTEVTTAHAIAKLLRASAVITTVIIAMQTLGFSVTSILAFGGVGGIVVGFAARDLLANFFGAAVVFFDRPFSVGDWIRSPDSEIEGIVEEIGWRVTRVRTFDKRPLYVPNSKFTSITIENPSRMSNRRIYETIGVRYDDVPVVAGILDDVRAMLRSHPEIDTKQTLMVNLNHFGESSVDFFVYTFTKTTDWAEFHCIKEDVLLKIGDIVTERGGEIAFPTRTLHLHQEPVQEPTDD